jgi:hypothetical protein
VGERILVYGQPGTGKSYQFLKVAQFVAPARCYVLDTDDAYPRMLDTDFRDMGNVEVYPVFEWDDWKAAVTDVLATRAKPGDWICIDRADVLWEAAQDYFIQQVFGEETGDFFLRARKEIEQSKNKLTPLDGWKDWGIINRVYRQLWVKLIMPNMPANLYVATTATQVEKQDEQEVQETFSFLGVKPGGQKHLPYGMHTILYLDRIKDGWRMTTVKDRGRKYLDKQKLVSLPHQYLIGVAGWGKK